MNLSMSTVSIPNIDINIFTRKSELPPGNFLDYLTQPEIKRQKPFKLTDIEYDQINY